MSKKSFLFLFLIAGALFLFGSHSLNSKASAAPIATETAKYKIVFNATWNPSTPHPYPGGTGTFPGSAHFSPLIGGVHNNQITFWQGGQLATAGIERMAETGSTIALAGEVNDAITSGHARAIISGSGSGTPSSTTINEITVATDHPLVTLVSMIAPSPDWFVGVSGLSLMENGDWVNEKTVDLTSWDAGTEEGTGFSLSNPDTVPPEVIRQLTTHSMGTFTFTRIDTPMTFYELAVSKTGNGTGVISSNPDGIDCGTTCTQSVLENTMVTLSATADAGSIFNGWSGAGCSGTGDCVVTMDEGKMVTADFSIIPTVLYELTVSKTGNGTGTISSNPAGIDCGATCTQSVLETTMVTLSATADASSLFSGWSGAGCSGTGDCVITMNESKSVTADFIIATQSIYLPVVATP